MIKARAPLFAALLSALSAPSAFATDASGPETGDASGTHAPDSAAPASRAGTDRPPPATPTHAARSPGDTEGHDDASHENGAPAPQTPPSPAVVGPVAIHTAQPLLPEGVLAPGESRTAELSVTIDAEGKVTEVKIVRSAGDALDEAALRAMHRWVFEPATRGGHPMAVRVVVPVTFEHPHHADAPGHGEPGHDHGPPDGTPDTDHLHGEPHALPGTAPAAGSAAGQGTPRKPTPDDGDLADPTAGDVQGGAMRTRVTKRAPLPPPTGASDYQIRLGALSAVPRADAGQFLTLSPGVWLENHAAEGHANRVFMRGFDAGEGRDIEVRLMGIPLNEVSHAHGHGYADTFVIVPELVDSVRVLQGPFDARQGDFAVAGSVDYTLAVPTPGLRVALRTGTFSSVRLSATYRPEDAPPGAFVGAALSRTAGYGVRRGADNMALNAQYQWRTAGTRMTVFAAAAGSNFQSPGQVRADAVAARTLPCDDTPDAQFFCTHDERQGGTAARLLTSGTLEHQDGPRTWTHRVHASKRNFRVVENSTGFVTDLDAPGGLQRGDALELTNDAWTLGAESAFKWRTGTAQMPLVHHAGVTVRHDDSTVGARRVRAADAVPYLTAIDRVLRVTDLGMYGQMEAAPLDVLKARLGLRADGFVFDVTDRNQPAADRTGPRLTQTRSVATGLSVMPKGSLDWAMTPDVFGAPIHGVVGAGLGTRSTDAGALSDGEFAPFGQVLAADMGLLHRARAGVLTVESRASAYYTHVEKDLVFDAIAGRNIPAGRSNRVGASLWARATVGDTFDIAASASWSDARFAETNPADPSSPGQYVPLTGAYVPYVPMMLGRVDTTWRGEFTAFGADVGVRAALGVSAMGPRALPLSQTSTPFVLVDPSLAFEAFGTTLELSAQNVLDARYAQGETMYSSYFGDPAAPPTRVATRHITAGSPRQIFLTLRFDTATFDHAWNADAHVAEHAEADPAAHEETP